MVLCIDIVHYFCENFMIRCGIVPGDGIKRDPERENCAVLTIAAQTANSIHIRITFNAVTRYKVGK